MKTLCSHISAHAGEKNTRTLPQARRVKKKITKKQWKLNFLCKSTCVLIQNLGADFHKILYLRLNKLKDIGRIPVWFLLGKYNSIYSVPKRRLLYIIRRRTTQKITSDIQNTEKA
jgi:hypothetical protein